MKLLPLIAAGMLAACSSPSREAVFADFTYTVNNAVDPDSATGSHLLLAGCYPDPSVVRVGNDYYMVNSSFAYFPGVPVWHSTDLKNWDRLPDALSRPSQLNLPDGMRLSGGIYAPDISYNPLDSLFYIITTLVDGGGNFYVTSADPRSGRWSDPVWLPEVGGIDPSILFEPDGRAYIVNNDGPEGEPLYDGHRTIRIHDFDWRNGRVTGEQQVIVDGGVDISQKPVWIEGPHLYHIGDTYFLMCAEGGTGPDHREVIFRSDAPKGPFVPCGINPILTQRDLDPSRPHPVTCAGHADLVSTPGGEWYAVFLGMRPYRGPHDVAGRETFIHPVEWKEGQPVITRSGETLVYSPVQVRDSMLWTAEALSREALFIRNPAPDLYVVDSLGRLTLTPSAVTVTERSNPAVILRRVTEADFTVNVTLLEFTPRTPSDIAGLVMYQDERCNMVFGKSLAPDGKGACVRLTVNAIDSDGESYTLPLDDPSAPLRLRISGSPTGDCRFLVSEGPDGPWRQTGPEVSADILSTATAGNFTGVMTGIYATMAR